ncbi:MAG: hypothetical protein JWQ85_4217 [Mucilaginibacter sp.]|nr:hypothetical protein [Mucilaginibacter sp.]
MQILKKNLYFRMGDLFYAYHNLSFTKIYLYTVVLQH